VRGALVAVGFGILGMTCAFLLDWAEPRGTGTMFAVLCYAIISGWLLLSALFYKNGEKRDH